MAKEKSGCAESVSRWNGGALEKGGGRIRGQNNDCRSQARFAKRDHAITRGSRDVKKVQLPHWNGRSVYCYAGSIHAWQRRGEDGRLRGGDLWRRNLSHDCG